MAVQTSNEEIEFLLERAKTVRMTQAQEAEQRRSFAYGNSAFENPRITKAMIEEQERKLAGEND